MSGSYEFVRGYPTQESARRAYDDADYCRAVQAYKFFFPTVAFWTGSARLEALGIEPSRQVAMMTGSPKQLVYTPNSDTPYAFGPIDLRDGPVVIEVPPGVIMGAVNDHNQLWVLDYGVPGPDGGKGGKHLLIPAGYDDEVPAGYYAGRSTTNKVTVLLRALPIGGDNTAANELIKSVRFYPLDSSKSWPETEWIDISQ
jgi:hypothetical protein